MKREPLRIPQSWKDQSRAFVIQLERILDNLFNRAEENEESDKKRDEEIESLKNGKADKVPTATSGNVAKFNSNGNIADSGYKIEKSVPSNAVFTDTTYSDATQSVSGLMSAADKTKLDGVATGATAVTVIDNLTSTSTTDALSANQGKALNDGKLDKNQGSANAGKNLYVGSDGKITSGAIIELGTISDLFVSTRSSNATYHFNYGNSTTNAPSTNGGCGILTTHPSSNAWGQITVFESGNKIWTCALNNGSYDTWTLIRTTNDIIDNLTSTSTTSALSANQGKVLKDYITTKTTAWKDAPVGVPGYYKYETSATSTYDIPSGYCIVQVIKQSASRGVAFAIRWNNGGDQMWINRLHDDTGNNNWAGWVEILTAKSATSTTFGTSTYTSHNTALGNRIIKQGNKVDVSITLIADSGYTYPSSTAIMSVPTGYRPSSNIKVPAMFKGSDDKWYAYEAWINSNGNVGQDWSSSCKGIYISASYLI